MHKANSTPDLSAHQDVDEGVVGRAGLGEEGRDDGHGGGDGALPSERLHHGHGGVGRPAHQEAGDHQQEHGRHLLLVAQDLHDLRRLEVLDGTQLKQRNQKDSKKGEARCCCVGRIPTIYP